jgi:transposase InsO family protein
MYLLRNILDEATRYFQTFVMHSRSELVELFLQYPDSLNAVGYSIIELKNDRAKEYVSLASILTKEGITHKVSFPYTPQSNGLAERINSTLIQRTQCLLIQSGLNNRL